MSTNLVIHSGAIQTRPALRLRPFLAEGLIRGKTTWQNRQRRLVPTGPKPPDVFSYFSPAWPRSPALCGDAFKETPVPRLALTSKAGSGADVGGTRPPVGLFPVEVVADVNLFRPNDGQFAGQPTRDVVQ